MFDTLQTMGVVQIRIHGENILNCTIDSKQLPIYTHTVQSTNTFESLINSNGWPLRRGKEVKIAFVKFLLRG